MYIDGGCTNIVFSTRELVIWKLNIFIILNYLQVIHIKCINSPKHYLESDKVRFIDFMKCDTVGSGTYIYVHISGYIYMYVCGGGCANVTKENAVWIFRSSTLKMETASSSESLVKICQTTRLHVQNDSNLHSRLLRTSQICQSCCSHDTSTDSFCGTKITAPRLSLISLSFVSECNFLLFFLKTFISHSLYMLEPFPLVFL
jgi:hypothetical protein